MVPFAAGTIFVYADRRWQDPAVHLPCLARRLGDHRQGEVVKRSMPGPYFPTFYNDQRQYFKLAPTTIGCATPLNSRRSRAWWHDYQGYGGRL